MKNWEYKVDWIDGRLTEASQIDCLNTHGKEGWELVSLTRTDSGTLICYFKRPKQGIGSFPLPPDDRPT